LSTIHSPTATAKQSAQTPISLAAPDALLENNDAFIFDCDGVIWRGSTLLPGVKRGLLNLVNAGKRCYFITNNSTQSRAGYKKKFDALGLDFVEPASILSSSYAAALHLQSSGFKTKHPGGKFKVYVVGEQGICDELDNAGIPWIGGNLDAHKSLDESTTYDGDVKAVVCGLDRNISYFKIQYAMSSILNNQGCEFIATNLDANTHLGDGALYAGGGSIVSALVGCTGVKPTVVGKPNGLMLDVLVKEHGLERERIVMVGDRLDTDIAFGNKNGVNTLLVMSGVTREEDIRAIGDKDLIPDYFTESVGHLFGDAARE
jgi:4-nitrophenyl phosphatase/phosphoglycolate phosphatase